MAIKKVPKITGTNFGGDVYGLSMSIGYSQQPSTLTLSIVNETGDYPAPNIGGVANIQFGSFSFIGYIWSYKISKNQTENTLEVTLIDGSIMLDRYYVLLWKRGLLGIFGSNRNLDRTFSFNEDVLVPVKKVNKNGYPFIRFESRDLNPQTVRMPSQALTRATSVGNVILVGREKFANSSCDIPDTYYYFNDLAQAVPGGINGATPNNSDLPGTHEGTLRQVLSSWAADLGYDYYWNFSSLNGGLTFFDVSNGISSLPSSVASNIISEDRMETLEGTFQQYGIAYTAMPRVPLKTLSASSSYTILSAINPFSLSSLSRRFGTKLELENNREQWGESRNQSEFLTAGFLGFISRELRDIYSFDNQHWGVLGYNNVIELTDKTKIVDFLKDSDYESMISDLESFDDKNLPNYDFIFASIDESIGNKWHDFEQLMLQSLGKYYRISDSSGSFVRCSSTFVSEIDISVEPEGTDNEEDNDDFHGKKIFTRDGKMSHDQSSALEELNYKELISEIDKCKPIQINLKESGLLDDFIESGFLDGETSKKINSLVLFTKKDFRKQKIGYQNPDLSKGNHPSETTIDDIIKANQNTGRKNCSSFEKAVENNGCINAEEIARKRAIKQAGGDFSKDNPDEYVSGLLNRSAWSCRISLSSGSVKLHAPCDGQYRTVLTYRISNTRFSNIQNPQFIFSTGKPGVASNVAEIRIVNENITDPLEDSFQSDRGSAGFVKAKDSSCTNPQGSVTYVFAGDPIGVPLSPGQGLSKLDVSLSSDGYKTTTTFSTRPPKLSNANNTMRFVNSQFNRSSYNSA